jgi:hypothetical protein
VGWAWWRYVGEANRDDCEAERGRGSWTTSGGGAKLREIFGRVSSFGGGLSAYSHFGRGRGLCADVGDGSEAAIGEARPTPTAALEVSAGLATVEEAALEEGE